MKKLSLFILITLLIVSCSVKKKPTFLKLGDVKLLSIANDTIKLEAKAYFKNENDIGGKISTEGVNVFIDEKPVANVKSEEFKVPANQEFSVPLHITVPKDKVFEKGMLGGLLNTLLKNKSIKVGFKGDIKYKVFGFSNNYPLDKTKELKIKF